MARIWNSYSDQSEASVWIPNCNRSLEREVPQDTREIFCFAGPPKRQSIIFSDR